MTQTRRLAAILAADVAGYSRLIGADEEGTLNRLRSLRVAVYQTTTFVVPPPYRDEAAPGVEIEQNGARQLSRGPCHEIVF